jgi:hypothetical protein
MKSSRIISCVRCLYETDVSGAISVVIIIREIVSYRHLNLLIAREDFIEFSRRESSRS